MADINHALASNGGEYSNSGFTSPQLSNDGSTGTYAYVTSGSTGTLTITFDSVNITSAVAYAWKSPTSGGMDFQVSLYYSGGWNVVGSDTAYGGDSVTAFTYNGSWTGVTGIKFYISAVIGGGAGGLYELEAWGAEAEIDNNKMFLLF